MPVWHRETAELRKNGKLVIVGITQEQHPDRTQLYKQWQGIDWPILWDPFNVTGAHVVPNFTLVDEHGIVRSTRPNLKTLQADFIDAEFAAPQSGVPPKAPVTEQLIEIDGLKRGPKAVAALPALTAMTRILWGEATPPGVAVNHLVALAKAAPEDAVAQFRAGVALRMRHDSDARLPTDFQGAVDAWERALALNPQQYIWRRRIQQYGPWLDKPYPFYDWVKTAQAEIRTRGAEPVALRAALSGAERGRPQSPSPPSKEPDPAGKVPRAESGWIDVSSAVAFDTSAKRAAAATQAARVHVTLVPSTSSGVKWNNEAQPLQVWIDRKGLPKGVRVSAGDLQVANGATAESIEPRMVDFEVEFPRELKSLELRGYAVFNACKSADGQCVFVRRDFEIELVR